MDKNKDLKKPYKGQCLCGGVKYEVDVIEPHMGHCHCSMCRKFHGAAFATLGEAKKHNFRWIEGEQLLKSYIAENGTVRRFCNNCGSSMTFEAAGPSNDLIEFSMGTLDSDVAESPDVHIYTGSKAGWYAIESSLPQYIEGRDSPLD